MKKLSCILSAGLLLCNALTAQTLQSVTQNGNTTSKDIILRPATVNDGISLQIGNAYEGISDVSSWVFTRRSDNFFSDDTRDFVFWGDRNGGYRVPLIFKNNGDVVMLGPRNSANRNVGIGTASPAYKLDVNGAVRVQSPAASNPMIGSRNPLYLDAANYNSNSSAIVFVKGNEPVAEIASDILANGGKDLYMIAGGNILLDPWNGTGNVGIGTQNPQSKLAVNGTITAKKLKITQEGWADYVFDSSYQLQPLHQVEAYIHANKHLPEVPTTAEVKKEGIDVGDNQVLLLKKIEELTLYIIQQNKSIETQNREMEALKKEMAELKARMK